jgi:F-type H+-transporting ATPase subunit epsilon
MNEKLFTFKIYTPQGLALEVKTDSVTVPGIDGEVGILPEHTQYTGVLGAGLVQYQAPGEAKPSRLVISGGFASFQVNELVLLVDSIDFKNTLNAQDISDQSKQLETRLSELNAFDPEWESTKQKLRRLDVISSLN